MTKLIIEMQEQINSAIKDCRKNLPEYQERLKSISVFDRDNEEANIFFNHINQNQQPYIGLTNNKNQLLCNINGYYDKKYRKLDDEKNIYISGLASLGDMIITDYCSEFRIPRWCSMILNLKASSSITVQTVYWKICSYSSDSNQGKKAWKSLKDFLAYHDDELGAIVDVPEEIMIGKIMIDTDYVGKYLLEKRTANRFKDKNNKDSLQEQFSYHISNGDIKELRRFSQEHLRKNFWKAEYIKKCCSEGDYDVVLDMVNKDNNLEALREKIIGLREANSMDKHRSIFNDDSTYRNLPDNRFCNDEDYEFFRVKGKDGIHTIVFDKSTGKWCKREPDTGLNMESSRSSPETDCRELHSGNEYIKYLLHLLIDKDRNFFVKRINKRKEIHLYFNEDPVLSTASKDYRFVMPAFDEKYMRIVYNDKTINGKLCYDLCRIFPRISDIKEDQNTRFTSCDGKLLMDDDMMLPAKITTNPDENIFARVYHIYALFLGEDPLKVQGYFMQKFNMNPDDCGRLFLTEYMLDRIIDKAFAKDGYMREFLRERKETMDNEKKYRFFCKMPDLASVSKERGYAYFFFDMKSKGIKYFYMRQALQYYVEDGSFISGTKKSNPKTDIYIRFCLNEQGGKEFIINDMINRGDGFTLRTLEEL